MKSPLSGDSSEKQCRQVCAELNRRLRAGEPCRAEDIFAAAPDLAKHPDFALEIIYTEFVACEELGRITAPEQWYARFPEFRERLERLFGIHEQLEAAPNRTAGSASAAYAKPETPILRLGRYEVIQELGRGGMGVVYLARQPQLNRLVALKMILAGAHADWYQHQRFLAEAQAVAKLRHPNIIQIYEIDEHDGQPFLALEYVPGGGLDKRLAAKPLPHRQAAELLETLARAIHHAHEVGIIHRDLKPANILLTGEAAGERDEKSADRRSTDEGGNRGTLVSDSPSHVSDSRSARSSERSVPKITDFGLAKDFDRGAGPTRTGAVLGTPCYMAPEQANGRAADVGPATDVYALGAILYETLTGRPPFQGNSEMEVLELVRSQEPVSVTRLQPHVARDLETITLKCLQKEPRRRYPTALALAEDLRRYLAHEPIQARPVTTAEKFWRWCRRKPAVAALLAALMMALIGGIAGVGWQWRAAVAESDAKAIALIHEKEERLKKEAALEAATDNLYFHGVALADREWNDNNPAYAEQLLAECPTDRRQWEWHYLDGLFQSSLLSGRDPHAYSVRTLFGAEGACLAMSVQDDGERLWNIATGAELGAVRGTGRKYWHGYLPLNAKQDRIVRPNDKGARLTPVLLTMSGRRPSLWDAATGRRLLTLPALEEGELPITFSADGRLLATATGPRWLVRIRDMETGQIACSLPEAEGWHIARLPAAAWPLEAAFSPDRRLFALTKRSIALVFDASSGAVVHRLVHTAATLFCVRFSPDGKQLAAAGTDQQVTLWDVETGKTQHTLQGHTQAIHVVAYSPDGKLLVSGGADRALHVWRTETGRRRHTFRGHPGSIQDVDFTPDGESLACACDDGTIKLWRVRAPQEAMTLEHESFVSSVAFAPDGRTLLSGCSDNTVNLWDSATGKKLAAYPAPGRAYAVDFRPDAKQFAAGGDQNTIQLYDTATGKPALLLRGHESYITGIRYHPNSAWLASAADDRTVRLWDVATGSEIRSYAGLTQLARNVAFSRDGTLLAAAGWDGVACVWETTTGALVRKLIGSPKGSFRVAFHPDGRRLAVAEVDGTVVQWDVQTGIRGPASKGHAAGTSGVAFSPDGCRLASCSRDQTLKLWDVSSGRLALTLHGHNSGVIDLVFSPDGRTLASCSVDYTVRLWRAPGFEPAAGAAP